MKNIQIDYDMLAIRCKMDRSEFNHPDFGEYVPLIRRGYDTYTSVYDFQTKATIRTPKHIPDEETFYIYKDNGAKILAVAHLDTVISTFANWTFEKAVLGANRRKETCLFNPQLDDRLGVYIILDLLPQFLGESAYDILLTNDEEVSASTAEDFIPPEGKEYNWIFQFDRRGTGAVLYDYEDTEWRATVDEYLHVEQGSFSDICKLYDLRVKGLNVGTGYHDEHQDWCYMVEEEVIEQVEAFIRFFKRHAATKFPHDPTTKRWSKFSAWDDDDVWGGSYKTGSYWNGSEWVMPAGTAGQSGLKGSSRWPLLTPSNGGTDVTTTGVPKDSGLKRIHARPLTDDINDDDDGSFVNRDFVANNEETLLSASLQRAAARISALEVDAEYLHAKTYKSADPSRWQELPAVQKLNTIFKSDEGLPPTLVSVYRNRVTGAECVECKCCSAAILIEDLFWTPDSVPVCAECAMDIPTLTELTTATPEILSQDEDLAWEVPLTDEQIRWLSEGGGIRKYEGGASRSFIGVDSSIERCYCSVCGQPEWSDKVVTFSNPLFTTSNNAEVCRVCFDSYQTT